MKKRIFFFAIIFVILIYTSLFAQPIKEKQNKQNKKNNKKQTVTITKDQFDTMMEKMNSMQKQIDSLQTKLSSIKPAAPNQSGTVENTGQNISKEPAVTTSLQQIDSTGNQESEKELQKLQQEQQIEDNNASSPQQTINRQNTGNPNISLIGDFIWNINHNKKIDGGSPFQVREVELAFQDKIDPWSRADVFTALHNENGDYHLHLEEAYLTLQQLPLGLQMKMGKFLLPFGKDNLLHQHARPYVDVPNVVYNFLGPEGLSSTGAEANAFIPIGKFYTELTGTVTNDESSRSFTNGQSGKPLYLGHLRSYFDLTESSNVELGYSHLRGFNNPMATRLSRLNGVDLTYRWKPLERGNYKSILLRGEYMWSRRTNPDRIVNTKGYYGFGQYQINKNWYLGARYDYSQFPNLINCNEKAYSGILTFFPTEFSYYRLQYKDTQRNYAPNYKQWLFQVNFLMGPHGAHKF
jgi:hypothetical protein